MFVGQRVTTPYGVGVILEVRNTEQVVVQPINWKMANDQKPTFYMSTSNVKPLFGINESVSCMFGIGIVKQIRSDDGIYVVTLSSWQLANRKSPTLYLNDQSLSKLESSPTSIVKSNSLSSFQVIYQLATTEKDFAKDAYKSKRFEEAKLRFAAAIDTMRRIDEEMSNEEKGRFFEMSLTCNSNLALCCWGLNDYPESILFARNAVTLIDAMESKMSNSELWKAIIDHGIMSYDKMKDLKVKSLRIIGKSELQRKNFLEAKAAFEAAYLLVPTDSKGQKELSELLSEASKKLIVEQKREKNVWQKAFKKGSKGEGDLYTSKKDDDSQVTNGSSSPETAAPTKIDPKNKDVSKENQLWKAENFFSGHMFGSFVFMGVLGLLGTAAYWWSRRRR